MANTQTELLREAVERNVKLQQEALGREADLQLIITGLQTDHRRLSKQLADATMIREDLEARLAKFKLWQERVEIISALAFLASIALLMIFTAAAVESAVPWWSPVVFLASAAASLAVGGWTFMSREDTPAESEEIIYE